MYIKSKLILEDNNWKYFLLDLVKYDENDREIKYTITENEIKGDKTEVDCTDIIISFMTLIISIVTELIIKKYRKV